MMLAASLSLSQPCLSSASQASPAWLTWPRLRLWSRHHSRPEPEPSHPAHWPLRYQGLSWILLTSYMHKQFRKEKVIDLIKDHNHQIWTIGSCTDCRNHTMDIRFYVTTKKNVINRWHLLFHTYTCPCRNYFCILTYSIKWSHKKSRNL